VVSGDSGGDCSTVAVRSGSRVASGPTPPCVWARSPNICTRRYGRRSSSRRSSAPCETRSLLPAVPVRLTICTCCAVTGMSSTWELCTSISFKCALTELLFTYLASTFSGAPCGVLHHELLNCMPSTNIYMTQVYTCYHNTVFILIFLTPSLHMFRPSGPSSGESQTLSFIFQEDFPLNGSVVLVLYNELLQFVPASYIKYKIYKNCYMTSCFVKVKLSRNRPWRPIRL
jgi:hypothetical protein